MSWAKLSLRTIQSGPRSRAGQTGKGNPYLKGILGEAAAAAARTDTFLGERYRRIVRRRGKLKALVAVACSILVIIWNLLADPAARYHDLGAGYYASRLDTGKKVGNHIRQLEALGYTVAVTPQPDPYHPGSHRSRSAATPWLRSVGIFRLGGGGVAAGHDAYACPVTTQEDQTVPSVPRSLISRA